MSSLSLSVVAQTSSPILLYQANPQTYTGTVLSQQSFNNRNPYRFEGYNCENFDGVNTISVADHCSQTATTINGEKYWSLNASSGDVTCRVLQPGYDGPHRNGDRRVTNGRTNANTQICATTRGNRGPNPFISVSVPFTFNPSMCQNGDAVVLTSRPDPLNPECRDVTLDDISANPVNYSQSERTCPMYIDDEVEITACRNSSCQAMTIVRPLDLSRVTTINYTNLCSVFSQGAGNYTVSLRAYDTGQYMYGSSSFYVTWLSWGIAPTISGNVFRDDNKNGLKDAGESNYTGSISITTDAGAVTTRPDGSYTITNVPNGSRRISYTSLPSSYSLTNPLNGPPPSFQVVVGTTCNTNGALGATCVNGSISNLNFGITNSMPWIQAYDLDIRFDNGFTNLIPATAQYPPYTIAQTPRATNPGVVFSGDSSTLFGNGQASSTNWLSGGTVYPEVFAPSTGNQLATSYQQITNTTLQADVTPIDLTTLSTCRNLTNCSLPPTLPSGVYRGNGSVTLNAYTVPVNSSYIFLVNGNLTLNGNISIPTGSTALFSAVRDIIVTTNVGVPATTPLPAAQIQGFYSAGEDFIVQGTNNCLSGADRMLNIAGAVVVNANGNGGNFSNQRDLCGDNPRYPSFTIQARPDFILNAPALIKKQNTSFREEAP